MKKFSKEYYEYLNSPKWNFKRNQIAEKCNFRCQLCNKKILRGFHIHHLTYEHFGNEPLSDLMFLCPECHLIKIHGQIDKTKGKNKKPKIKKLKPKFTTEEMEQFTDKKYFFKNYDKLNPKEKSIISRYLMKNHKKLFREMIALRNKVDLTIYY